MKNRILELRAAGKTYKEIQYEIGCSKGTISYHCGDGQKEKTKIRTRKNRLKSNEALRMKMDAFLRDKVRNFKCPVRDKKRIPVSRGSAEYISFYKMIEDKPICYLTGRSIDLSMPSTYSLDHIIPVSKGGKNDLSNCGLVSRKANMAKTDMSLSEFISLCQDVVNNQME